METRTRHAVKLSLQPRGAVLGGAGVALLAAGLWRVDGALAALGLAAFALPALAWILARVNLAGLETTLQCAEKIQAGVVFSVLLTLTNRRKWWDAFDLNLDVELAGQTKLEGRTGWLAAGSATDLELRATIPQRAATETHRSRVSSDFPFGLWVAVRVTEITHPMRVWPRPVVPRDLWFSGGALESPSMDGIAAGEAAGEPHGLRPWRAGDSPKRIVWPPTLRSFARGAGLVVSESDPPADFLPSSCAVVFHSYGSDRGLIRPDQFEKALSLTAGTLRHLFSQGIAVRFLADFDDWTPRRAVTRQQVGACIEQLAVVTRAYGTEAHDVQAALASVADDEGLIILSDMPVSSWRSALPESTRPCVPNLTNRRKRLEVKR